MTPFLWCKDQQPGVSLNLCLGGKLSLALQRFLYGGGTAFVPEIQKPGPCVCACKHILVHVCALAPWLGPSSLRKQPWSEAGASSWTSLLPSAQEVSLCQEQPFVSHGFRPQIDELGTLIRVIGCDKRLLSSEQGKSLNAPIILVLLYRIYLWLLRSECQPQSW